MFNGFHPVRRQPGISERQEGLTGAEERVAGTLFQVRKGVFRVGRAQHALFAYVDTLVKAY